MHRAITLAAIATVSLAACKSGDRQDTAAPIAQLKIVDITIPAIDQAGGACAADFAPDQTWPEVRVDLRARCLALDASASSAGADLTPRIFTFARLDPNEQVVETLAENSSSSTLVLPPEVRAALPLDEPIRFRVTVHDALHRTSVAEQSVTLLNSRPMALGDGPQILPLHGNAWAPDQPVLVTFDASLSRDTDGDPLIYCWTLPDQAETCSSQPVAEALIPVNTRARFIARLRVSDGKVYSDSISEPVDVDEPVAWSGTGRLDFRESPLAFPAGEFAAHALPGATPAMAIAATQTAGMASFTVGMLADAMTFAPPISLPSSELPRKIVASADGSEIFAIGSSAANAASGLAATRISVAWNAGTATLAGDAPLDLEEVLRPPDWSSKRFTVSATVDGNGNLWIARGAAIALLPAGETSPVLAENRGRVVVDMQARPGTSEVWSLRNDPSEDSSRVSTIERWTNPNAKTEFDLPGIGLSELRWVSPNLFWLTTTKGAFLVEASLLINGMTLDQAIVFGTQGSYDQSQLQVDPTTGTAWFRFSPNGVVVLALDASRFQRDLISGSAPFEIDGAGLFWLGKGRLTRTHSVDPSGIAALEYHPDLAPAQVDPRSGGLWIAGTYSSGLGHVAADGTHFRLLPTTPIAPFFYSLRAAPDGQTLWSWSGSALSTIRLGVDPAPMTVVASGNAFTTLYGGAQIFLPSTPGPSPAFTWSVSTRIPFDVVAISTSGVITTVATIDSSEAAALNYLIPHAALLPSDNSVCLATQGAPLGPAPIRVHRIRTDGNVQDLGMLTGTLERVASSSLYARDLCWISYKDGPNSIEILALDSAGNAVHSTTLAASYAGEILPLSNDTLLIGTPPEVMDPGNVHRLDFDPSRVSVVSDTVVPAWSWQYFIRNDAE